MTVLGVADSTARLKDTVIPVKIGWDLYQKGFPVDQGRGIRFLSAFAADVDRDGSLEVFAADTAGQISAWRSSGAGYRYANGAFVNVGTTLAADIALGDVTGNANLEVVAAGEDGKVRVYSSAGALLAAMSTGDHISRHQCSRTSTATARRI